jgi:hypothetical protein
MYLNDKSVCKVFDTLMQIVYGLPAGFVVTHITTNQKRLCTPKYIAPYNENYYLEN